MSDLLDGIEDIDSFIHFCGGYKKASDKYEAEIKRLKHELEEALQEISSLKQCDC